MGSRGCSGIHGTVLGGGDMIEQVTKDRVTYQRIPQKFEAGTPAIAEAIGLGSAVEYLTPWDGRRL